MASLLRKILGRRDATKKRLSVRPRRKRRRRPTVRYPEEGETRIKRFREWCEEVGIRLHQSLYIGREGSCADVGVVAERDIPAGTVLATIPRAALLNAANSSVAAALLRDGALHRQMTTMNSWVPLLLALLTETDKKTSSFWWPYLALVPSERAPGPAHQWSPEERSQLLQGTGVEERVQQDLVDIERDYCDIVLPFLQRHPQLCHKSSVMSVVGVARRSQPSLQQYLDLVCLVMAYSFTDSEERDMSRQTMMVPFVDLLNHHSNHHAELSFHPSHLELVAVRNISQGSEIMNTYGHLPNASLLHVYGFTEEGNPHDVALIQSTSLREVYSSFRGSHDMSCDRRWERVRGDVSQEEFEVDLSGVPELSLLAAVKLLLVEEDNYDSVQNFVMDEGEDLNIESLSAVEKEFLQSLCRTSLAKLSTNNYRGRGSRDKKRFSSKLSSGQQLCLERLEKALT